MKQVKKDADLLLGQRLTTPDLIMSTCSQNENSLCDEINYWTDIIEAKKEVNYSRDDDGHKFSPYEDITCQKLKVINHILRCFGLLKVVCQRKPELPRRGRAQKMPQHQQ